MTIIADYRLVPNSKFPDPASDIRDAFAFAVEHAGQINEDSPVQADFDRVFFMGHSAGAAILGTMLLLPDFLPDDLRARIRGVILQGGAYHYRTGNAPPPPAAPIAAPTTAAVAEPEPASAADNGHTATAEFDYEAAEDNGTLLFFTLSRSYHGRIT